jgi:hypothetical protein
VPSQAQPLICVNCKVLLRAAAVLQSILSPLRPRWCLLSACCSRTLLRASFENEARETASTDDQEEQPQDTTGASESASLMPSICEDTASGHEEAGPELSQQPRRLSLHDRRSGSPLQPHKISIISVRLYDRN